MSWGALYFYYKCPKCGKLFKYSIDLIPEYQDEFGNCPVCNIKGEYLKEGAADLDDLLYEDID
ncbi:hypothetical protein [uncultured Brachyspira sp.]|uniref:hypothetical protein n=1 Tax=uncultured Brachyspira sp. TaxID=221953 RepID=UPI002611DB34|nr:hypothetical protein [uncultured Brachyspira sp.]